jgi:hypothetical protein
LTAVVASGVSEKGSNMSTLQIPRPEHVQFDEMCAPVEDFEPLPTVVAGPDKDGQPESDATKGPQELDGLILAGLVTPY